MNLKIIKAGLLDTVQDLGRYGYQHQGINPSGAMDKFSASLANALLGKASNAPVIELHFPAAEMLFQTPAIICLTGADFTPMLDGEMISVGQPIAIKANSVLSFKSRRSGTRCYFAMLNNLEMILWLNSYSTNLKASAGGYKGKALKKNDAIAFAEIDFTVEKNITPLPWRYSADKNDFTEIQVIPGPEWNWLTVKTQTAFQNNSFAITPASDRMGYRLGGEALEQVQNGQLISSAVTFGTVQLLPNGQLIVLMADHQTTGGYPRIATVISTHLPHLAQKASGEKMNFALTTIAAAEEKLLVQQKFLSQLQNTCNLKMQNWIHAH